MKGFIEATDNYGTKVLINIKHIFAVYPYGDECQVNLTPQGPNGSSFAVIYTKENYEAIRELISEALK